MIDFDQETWIYLGIITLVIIYFLWSSNRNKRNRKARKNRNFRIRYMERKKKSEKKNMTKQI
ncbi:hypothetical protein L1I30_10540 [Gillisia sp. M10.2A]|uniref:Uncharacterized protein n=1 Tax=Gillisia lutea TaxID=2909668 RepID=A0ABS9EJX1_9FLAO|nr:hypothetical protein [Gillisia lutea]MCF4102105.1 hypothetical protein [Gillisia lutea]